MEVIRSGEDMTIRFDREIDHCRTKEMREMIDAALDQSEEVVQLYLDFSGVEFMDSSGIGLIIGRYKKMKERGGTVTATGVHPAIRRIYTLAGLHRIIPVQEER